MIIGHLGNRVSALLDGQLSAEDTERAWEHVHQCHQCRDQVEREGWVKTRLAGLAHDGSAAPLGLKGSLLGAPQFPVALTPGDSYLATDAAVPRRRTAAIAMGGGAVGAAVMGVLALGVAPASAPTAPPITSISQQTGQPGATPSTPAASPSAVLSRSRVKIGP